MYLAATKQLREWYSPSVCTSVRPSVTPFSQYFCHRIIIKVSAIDISGVHAKCHGQRSKVKFTEVKTNVWAFPGRNSSLNSQMTTKWWTKFQIAYKRWPIVFQGHPSNFKVIRDKKSPILTRNERFWTVTQAWIHKWLWNEVQSLRFPRRGVLLFFEVIYKISMSHGPRNWRFGFFGRKSNLNSRMVMKWRTLVLWNFRYGSFPLTRCSLMTPYVVDLGQHWLRNDILSDGTQPLPEPILAYHQRHPLAFSPGRWLLEYWRYHPQVVFEIYIFEITATSRTKGMS